MADAAQQRFCLITGASRGFGKALAERFWQQGWSLVLTARTREALRETVASLGSKDRQSLHTVAADLARPEGIETIAQAVPSDIPRLDVLVNNAGIQGPVGPAWENDGAEWMETVQINLLAPAGLCRRMVPWMIQTGGGSIINLSGGGATGPREHFSAYASAKAGLVRFSETLAREIKPHRIRVNCVAPGAMATAMLEKVVAMGEAAAGKKEYATAVRALREGDASMQRALDLCLFLASDASAGITGKLISALWDNWERWPEHLKELEASDAYTLRRIAGRDRGFSWGDA